MKMTTVTAQALQNLR